MGTTLQFRREDLKERTRKCYEIYFCFFSVRRVATAIKALCSYCGRVFVCNSILDFGSVLLIGRLKSNSLI